MFKPVMVVMLVFLCTVIAAAQTASAVQVDKDPGEATGSVIAVIDGRDRMVAEDAFNAWLADSGHAVLYSNNEGVGGYEREGQALWRYDVAKGSSKKLMSELYAIDKVVETNSASGKTLLLVTMVDGGLGAPHVAVVDPQRGEVWRQIMAKFVGVRNGKIAVALYSPKSFESDNPQPDKVIYKDMDALLNKAANPYVPVQTGGKSASITGSITYKERIALPAGAVVSLELVDATTGKRIAQNTILQPGQVPISFDLYYDPSQINPNDVYRVNATITVNGGLWFRNTKQYPVITGGSPNKVEMVLTKM